MTASEYPPAVPQSDCSPSLSPALLPPAENISPRKPAPALPPGSGPPTARSASSAATSPSSQKACAHRNQNSLPQISPAEPEHSHESHASVNKFSSRLAKRYRAPDSSP